MTLSANSTTRTGPAVGHRTQGLVHADVIDQVETRPTGPADRAIGTAVEAVGNGAAGHAGEIRGEVVEVDADEALAERVAAAAPVGGAILTAIGGGIEEEALPAADHAPPPVAAQRREVAVGAGGRRGTGDTALDVAVEVAALPVSGDQETVIAPETGRRGGTERAVGDAADRRTDIRGHPEPVITGLARGGRGTDRAIGDIAVGHALRPGSVGREEVDAGLTSAGSGTPSTKIDLTNISRTVEVASGRIERPEKSTRTLSTIIGGSTGSAAGVRALDVAGGPAETDSKARPATAASGGSGA